MRDPEEKPRPVHENLDTAYVNLPALVAYLEAREFTGLVRAMLEACEGMFVLRAGEETFAGAREHASGEASEGDAASRLLFASAREPGGIVSVYELTADEAAKALADWADAATTTTEDGARATEEVAGREELLALASELMAAVERAVVIAGGDFAGALHAARLTLAEDFPFLDPFARRFDYAEGRVRLDAEPSERLFVSGLCEMLRRAVAHVADAEQKIGVRRDTARELSILLRRRRSRLERFNLTHRQLERIAGMKLL